MFHQNLNTNRWLRLSVFAMAALMIALIGSPAPADASVNCDSINVSGSGWTGPTFNFRCYRGSSSTSQSVNLPHVASTYAIRDWATTKVKMENGRPVFENGQIVIEHGHWNSDGCSGAEFHTPLGVFLTSKDGLVLPGDLFEAACMEHDFCYVTLGVTRAICDNNFFSNMNFICDIANNGQPCHDVATIMAGAVAEYGGEAYNDAQSKARRSGSYPG